MARRLTRDARLVVTRAHDEAAARQAPMVEAEHLLLAMTQVRATSASRALAAAGLNRDAVESALRREFENGLASAGVQLTAGDLPSSSPVPEAKPRMGASSKAVLVRAFHDCADKHLRTGHLLIAVLGAEVGTVPRALELAGIDRVELRDQAERELAGASK